MGGYKPYGLSTSALKLANFQIKTGNNSHILGFSIYLVNHQKTGLNFIAKK